MLIVAALALLRFIWSLPCIHTAPPVPQPSLWEEWADGEGRSALQSLSSGEDGME